MREIKSLLKKDLYYYFRLKKACLPLYSATSPNSSEILISWLYLATLSDLAGAPVLIWPALTATTKSAIVVASVSPDLWEITAV